MSIAQNKKAFHDYFVEERYEAGLVLHGWEVKAIRAGRAQIHDAYVVAKDGALWLIGAHVAPLLTASTHVSPDPTRTRKLLLHAAEIKKLDAKPDVKEKLNAFGSEPFFNGPEETAALLRADIDKYGKIIKDANIKPQ